jgi:hypothetical protein
MPPLPAPSTPPAEPRYGREVVGRRLRLRAAADKPWRTGAIKHFHGGYLKHTGACRAC